MKLKQLVAAVAGAFCLTGASAVTIQLPTGPIDAASLDWTQTSFLAQGGVTAIGAYAETQGECPRNVCDFNVFTHAKVTTYANSIGQSGIPIPGINTPGGFELSMVAGFTETVTFVAPNFAEFSSVRSSGFLQLYLDTSVDADDLAGTGFNDGRLVLVGRLADDSFLGSFRVTDRDPTIDFDQFNDDDWAGQQTVDGFGSQEALEFEVLGFDPTVFPGGLQSLSILFENVSIGLPFLSVDPSKCFNKDLGRGVADIGSTLASTNCSDGGAFDGILPVIGNVNGGDVDPARDFMAQTDFNSPLSGEYVPEPGSLALIAGALIAAGGFTRRRREKA